MSAELARGAQTELDLVSQEIYMNPHPHIHRLRAEDPVHWSRRLESWLITRYDDVTAALRDSRLGHTGAQRRMSRLPPEVQEQLLPLRRSVDQWMGLPAVEDHERHRKLLNRHFTQRSIAAWRPRIETHFENVLARAGGRREIDAVHELSYPFGASVIADFIGLIHTQVDDLLRWSHDLVEVFQVSLPEVLHRAQGSMFALEEQIRAEIARRGAPTERGDLIDGFLAGKAEDLVRDDEEIVANCVALVFVGFETSSNMIAQGLSLLLERPGDLAKLRTEPELVPGAIDEMLRYDGPAFFISRVAREDFELRGKQIRANDLVLLGLGPANRDPAVFPDPDYFDVARKPNKHLGFAIGPYSCLGALLARSEVEVAFHRLLGLPQLRPGAAPVRWKEFRPFGRRLVQLPVGL